MLPPGQWINAEDPECDSCHRDDLPKGARVYVVDVDAEWLCEACARFCTSCDEIGVATRALAGEDLCEECQAAQDRYYDIREGKA